MLKNILIDGGWYPFFFNSQSYEFGGTSGILVSPDERVFKGIVNAARAKRILLEKSGVSSRLSRKDIK